MNGKSMTVRADEVEEGDVLTTPEGNTMVRSKIVGDGEVELLLSYGRTDPGHLANYDAGEAVSIWRANR